jgi:hypothetical protein
MGLLFFNPKLEAVFSVQNLPSSVSLVIQEGYSNVGQSYLQCRLKM